ncbi:MAG: exodeoxyribonuclease VII large subunit, partial [Paracoccaceae bacterium]|nr:exodeoxyribonuclease VII large subunit [Paracoccaceae bacterium]
FMDAERGLRDGRTQLAVLEARLNAAQAQQMAVRGARLESLDRTRQSLGYGETLRRGYAVVRGDGAVVTSKIAAESAGMLEIEFHDGRLALGARGMRGRKVGDAPGGQGSLF